MACDENGSIGIITVECIGTTKQIVGQIQVSVIETSMNSTTTTSGVGVFEIIKIIKIIGCVNTTSDGNDNFVGFRIITTITLGFVGIIVESLNMLHSKIL